IFSLLVSGPVASAQLENNSLGNDVTGVQGDIPLHQIKNLSLSTQTQLSQCAHTCVLIDFLSLRPQFQRIGLLNGGEFFMKGKGLFKQEFPTPILGPPRHSA
ncbi:MAG: hypothetical protein L3J13_09245, partial [Devosiaceae bacterium]|nr:hypothetical protein [Devosiaceae bacterium]